MSYSPPCARWAEKLALKRADLLPEECVALDMHVSTCQICRAAQSDYQVLIARMKSLPPPMMRPLPRLALRFETHDDTAGLDEQAWKPAERPRRVDGVNMRRARRGAFSRQVKKTLPAIWVAGILLCILLGGSLYRTLTSVSHSSGTALVTYREHSGFVSAVAWSPNGIYLASGSWDKSVQIWNAKSGVLINTYKGHSEIVDALAWSPDGRYIASGSWDHTVQVWDAITNRLITTYTGHTQEVWSLAWSPDGQTIASGGWDHTIQVWNAFTGAHLRTYNEGNELVNAVAWSPDGTRIASGGTDNQVWIWDAVGGDNVAAHSGTALANYPYGYGDTVNTLSNAVNTLAWSPDGHYVAAGGRDNQVKVWDVRTNQIVTTYTGHRGEVNALAWSPNGAMIASGSDDHTVQVWNVKDAKMLLTYTGHSNDVAALAWSPDGTRIASGSWDNTVQIWRALPGK